MGLSVSIVDENNDYAFTGTGSGSILRRCDGPSTVRPNAENSARPLRITSQLLSCERLQSRLCRAAAGCVEVQICLASRLFHRKVRSRDFGATFATNLPIVVKVGLVRSRSKAACNGTISVRVE